MTHRFPNGVTADYKIEGDEVVITTIYQVTKASAVVELATPIDLLESATGLPIWERLQERIREDA